MALNIFKCNCLTPLHFKWLRIVQTYNTFTNSITAHHFYEFIFTAGSGFEHASLCMLRSDAMPLPRRSAEFLKGGSPFSNPLHGTHLVYKVLIFEVEGLL